MPGSTQRHGLCPGEDCSSPLKVARQWLVDGSSPAKAADTRTERINECVELEPRERANAQWLAPSLSHSEGPASPDVSAHLLLGLWLLGDSGARTRDVLLQKSCLGSSAPPTRPKVMLENLSLFCGRVSLFPSPSFQHSHFLGSATLPGKEHCLSCRWCKVGPHFFQRTSKLKVKYSTPTL